MQTLRGSNDVRPHVMDRVAPPRYRLEQPIHCLGSRSQHHCTALPRRPGYRKATPLVSARRLELGGSPRRLVVVADLDATNSAICPSPAPYFPLDRSQSSRSLRYVLWQPGEFGKIRIHIVPRLRAGCVDVRLWRKPVRIIEATGHNAYDIRRCGRLTEQPGATIRAEAATDNAAAISDDFVVFHLSSDINRTGRDKNRRGECAARRPLAITEVAIPHSNRVGSAPH